MEWWRSQSGAKRTTEGYRATEQPACPGCLWQLGQETPYFLSIPHTTVAAGIKLTARYRR